jgi:hypothetical protein
VTRSFDPAHPGSTAGLFRPADHVLIVPQGSVIAILDLEQGIVYATTPFGAESWSMLVAGAPQPRRAMAETASGSDHAEGSDARARIAGYLLDCRIIEPVVGGTDVR